MQQKFTLWLTVYYKQLYFLVARTGFEPVSADYETAKLTYYSTLPYPVKKVSVVGVEPTSLLLWAASFTIKLYTFVISILLKNMYKK